MVVRGLCECGCGERTNRAKATDARRGWVKGEPRRFLRGHQRRTWAAPEDYEVMESGCWEWRRNKSGQYGVKNFRDGSQRIRVVAHRWMYEQEVGPIPEGCELHHVCRNPICVNPDHLKPLTISEHRKLHPPYWEIHPNAKLTIEQARVAKQEIENGRTIASVAREYDVDYTTMWGLARGRTYRNAVAA